MWLDDFSKSQKIQQILRDSQIKADKSIEKAEADVKILSAKISNQVVKAEQYFNSEKSRLEGEKNWKKSLLGENPQNSRNLSLKLKEIEGLYNSQIESRRLDLLKVKNNLEVQLKKEAEMLRFKAQTESKNIILQGKRDAEDERKKK